MQPPNRWPSGRFMPLAWEQMMTHKWLESQKAQRDLGRAAIEDWLHRYWIKFVRERRREHLNGEQHWREFEDED